MFKKQTIIIFLFLLAGCSKPISNVACTCFKPDSTIQIQIKASGDDIDSIDIITSFEIPNEVLLDEDKYNFLLSQLNDSFYFENNILFKKECVVLDDKYSLEKTINNLRGRRFNCE